MLTGVSTLTVKRRPGSWTAAGWTPAAEQTITVRGSVQPIDPATAELLPEGARRTARFALYCDVRQPELRIAEPGASHAGDVVLYGGRRYVVHRVADWTAHTEGLPHRVYALTEAGADE